MTSKPVFSVSVLSRSAISNLGRKRFSSIFAFTKAVEWPTIALVIACYGLWAMIVFWGESIPALLWILCVGLLTTLYYSIQHEVVHNHPTKKEFINQMLVFLPIGWVFPYGRFKALHLQHHETGELTDPFDDPETWYEMPENWKLRSRISQQIRNFNNTLFGRLIIGPIIAVHMFISGELKLIIAGKLPSGAVAQQELRRQATRDWIKHTMGLVILVWILQFSAVALWQLFFSTYFGISVLLIRTFAEHQASEAAGERTVIIEDKGLLAFLFLFNNLHVAHHLRPSLPWYCLPGFYKRHRNALISRNNGYVFENYGKLFKQYFFTSKEPIAHPYR